MESCKLSKDDENLFSFMWQLSLELDKEIGVAYCRSRDHRLHPFRLCIGDKCSQPYPGVLIEPCATGQKRMDVHTHPRLPIPIQSIGDIMESSHFGMQESCIIDREGRVACTKGFNKVGLEVRSQLYELRHECGKERYDNALAQYQEGAIPYAELAEKAEPYYRCIMREIPNRTKLKVCEDHL